MQLNQEIEEEDFSPKEIEKQLCALYEEVLAR
jgi:hypothetical protein